MGGGGGAGVGVVGWVWAGGVWVEEELLGLVWRVWRVGRERDVVGCARGLWLGPARRPRAEAGASARQRDRELEDLVSYTKGMLAAGRSLGFGHPAGLTAGSTRSSASLVPRGGRVRRGRHGRGCRARRRSGLVRCSVERAGEQSL